MGMSITVVFVVYYCAGVGALAVSWIFATDFFGGAEQILLLNPEVTTYDAWHGWKWNIKITHTTRAYVYMRVQMYVQRCVCSLFYTYTIYTKCI